MPEQARAQRRDPSGTIGRNIEAFLLLDLLRESSYGYDLIRRLGEYGFRRALAEPGVVYKVLRALEDSGSILSEWSTRESGPARRYYHITEQGQDLLRRRAYQLQRYVDRAQRLLGEYVAMTGDDLATDASRDPTLPAAPAVAGTTLAGL